MKRFYIPMMITLLLLTALAVAGQPRPSSHPDADVTLVAGQPPLTQAMINRLVELFEWGLDGHLTGAQRGEFTRRFVEVWRQDARQEIKAVEELLEIQARLASLSETEREQLHASFQAQLLENLRRREEDATSRLLLAVYESAHRRPAGESGEPTTATTTAHQPEAEERPAEGLPAQMIGRWRAGTVSATTFVNRNTGAVSDPSGTQVLYHIMPDGRYEYAALTQQSMYSCTTRLLTYKTGVVTVRGATLTFIPREGKFTSEDSCNRHNNYEKPATLERETYAWHVERDQYGEKLCLQKPGVNGCAYKQ